MCARRNINVIRGGHTGPPLLVSYRVAQYPYRTHAVLYSRCRPKERGLLPGVQRADVRRKLLGPDGVAISQQVQRVIGQVGAQGAGAGGKTLHLSALMNNKGNLYATDFQPARMEQLSKRAATAGCQNIKRLPYKAAQGLKDMDLVKDAEKRFLR